MSKDHSCLYFDFVDPLSYLVELELAALDAPVLELVDRMPFELLPPPSPLVEIDHPSVSDRWARARELAPASGVSLGPPRLVPWTRKAHELHLFAISHGVGPAVRTRLYESYVRDGRDIGRIDVLVEIGRAAGLDPGETKAVLDVDRFESEVVELREAARARGIAGVPVLVRGSTRLEGFHNREALGTFLRES